MPSIDPNNLMTQLVANSLLDEAYYHLCHAKKETNANHDIWSIRHEWPRMRRALQVDLTAGCYGLSPAKALKIDDHSVLVWTGQDTIVLKALSLLLERTLYPRLGVYTQCYHTKGKGLKAAIQVAHQQVQQHPFVFKTDIKSYYASLDRHKIQASLSRWIKDKRILSLIWQYCDRVEDVNGTYLSNNTGIPKGGPLSVVLGTLYLVDMDRLTTQQNIKYVRYMDDVLIFCKNRFLLRKIIKQVYRILATLKLTLAKSKTYIGKAGKGFDFLGYRIGAGSPDSIRISQTSIQRFRLRLQRLYEQRASNTRVAAYVKQWCRWATSGLGHLNVEMPDPLFLVNNPDNSGPARSPTG